MSGPTHQQPENDRQRSARKDRRQDPSTVKQYSPRTTHSVEPGQESAGVQDGIITPEGEKLQQLRNSNPANFYNDPAIQRGVKTDASKREHTPSRQDREPNAWLWDGLDRFVAAYERRKAMADDEDGEEEEDGEAEDPSDSEEGEGGA